jgi:hypothetical protein
VIGYGTYNADVNKARRYAATPDMSSWCAPYFSAGTTFTLILLNTSGKL